MNKHRIVSAPRRDKMQTASEIKGAAEYKCGGGACGANRAHSAAGVPFKGKTTPPRYFDYAPGIVFKTTRIKKKGEKNEFN
jgi:hypothetical protein